MKTRLRTPLTDQSSRIPPHLKKCTRTAKCFIGCHPGTSSTLIRTSVSSRTIQRRLAERHLGSWQPLRLLSHTSTPPFGVVLRTMKLDCSGMEPGHLLR
ncbi:uncharacterized protein TNCV_2275531 [Trichonephila clavipes]|nr:uncharacterized protein TNCV_2275531 [Trichonephila clavipes]